MFILMVDLSAEVNNISTINTSNFINKATFNPLMACPLAS